MKPACAQGSDKDRRTRQFSIHRAAAEIRERSGRTKLGPRPPQTRLSNARLKWRNRLHTILYDVIRIIYVMVVTLYNFFYKYTFVRIAGTLRRNRATSAAKYVKSCGHLGRCRSAPTDTDEHFRQKSAV